MGTYYVQRHQDGVQAARGVVVEQQIALEQGARQIGTIGLIV